MLRFHRRGVINLFGSLRAAALLVFLIVPSAVDAQLRPLEPMDWTALNGGAARIEMRVGYLNAQRASLAGTEGQLFEVGEVRATVPVHGVLLELAGTPQRYLFDEEVFAAPTGDAQAPSSDRRRHDSGDYRVGAAFRLAQPGAVDVVLRFGTRLPTTDNRIGLERDQTDFYGLLGGGWKTGRVAVGAEAGVGIHGTRISTYEQSDVLLYAVRAELVSGSLAPHVVLTGQNDLKSREIRGNEDLSEVRLGLTLGKTRWLTASLVAGLTEFSPEWGLLVGGGFELR